MLELTVESLDQDGRGVARSGGKVVFVDGALPREVVETETLRHKSSFDVARMVAVRSANPGRCAPRCPHFGTCGGCSLQHADLPLQVAAKQRVLEEALARIGGVHPATLLPAIAGPAWGYRHRARLSVRDVPKKGGILVGFHERRSRYVADMRECHVLPPRLSELLLPLRALVASLSIRARLPQIEIAVGERLVPRSAAQTGTCAMQPVYALVLRVLEAPSETDLAKLVAFADTHGVEFWLQPGGPETVVPFHPPSAALAYTLPEFDVALPFSPTDFTQVNAAVNRVLVRRALQLLAPQPHDHVADFFCGLGNFTLPIARRGAFATGFEGSRTLVARALENARRNGLGTSTAFVCANLFDSAQEAVARAGRLDRVLLDPPREGAIELVKALPACDAAGAPQRVVYVSCNPATLARDAAVLVHQRGYALEAAGIVNMFPHTAHVESIALFTR